MKNVLILHGTGDSSKSHWYPWLKEELERKGWRVFLPDLPDPAHPDAARWSGFLLGSGWVPDEETVIIGHSAGAVAMLSLLPKLPVRIKAAVFVSAFKEDLGRRLVRNFFTVPFDIKMLPVQFGFAYLLLRGDMSLAGLFPAPFDIGGAKAHTAKSVFIHADDDPYCPLSGAQELARRLGGEFVLLHGGKHFSVSTIGEQGRRFPHLLSLLEQL